MAVLQTTFWRQMFVWNFGGVQTPKTPLNCGLGRTVKRKDPSESHQHQHYHQTTCVHLPSLCTWQFNTCWPFYRCCSSPSKTASKELSQPPNSTKVFCSLAVFDPTYFLHLSLSSVILTDSSSESPVHVLVLSIQAVRGLRRLRAPGIVPCVISFLMMRPQYASFRALTVSSSCLFTPV